MTLTLEQLQQGQNLLKKFINDQDIKNNGITIAHLNKYNNLFIDNSVIKDLLNEQIIFYKEKKKENQIEKDRINNIKTQDAETLKNENNKEYNNAKVRQIQIENYLKQLDERNANFNKEIGVYEVILPQLSTQYKNLQDALNVKFASNVTQDKESEKKLALLQTCKIIDEIYKDAIKQKKQIELLECIKNSNESKDKKIKNINHLNENTNLTNKNNHNISLSSFSLCDFKQLSNITYRITGGKIENPNDVMKLIELPGMIDLNNVQLLFKSDQKNQLAFNHDNFQEIILINQYLEDLKLDRNFENYYASDKPDDTNLISCYDEFEKMQVEINKKYQTFYQNISSKFNEINQAEKDITDESNEAFKKEIAKNYKELVDECTKAITDIEKIKTQVEKNKDKGVNKTKYEKHIHTPGAQKLKESFVKQSFIKSTMGKIGEGIAKCINIITLKKVSKGSILAGMTNLVDKKIFSKDGDTLSSKEIEETFDITEHKIKIPYKDNKGNTAIREETVMRINISNYDFHKSYEINLSAIKGQSAGKTIEFCPNPNNLNQFIREETTNNFTINDDSQKLYIDLNHVKGIGFELKIFTITDKDNKESLKLCTTNGSPLNAKQLDKVIEAFGGKDKLNPGEENKKEITINGIKLSEFAAKEKTSYKEPASKVNFGVLRGPSYVSKTK